MDRLFRPVVKLCPQAVDNVENLLCFLIIYFSTLIVSYIYKSKGLYSLYNLVFYETDRKGGTIVGEYHRPLE